MTREVSDVCICIHSREIHVVCSEARWDVGIW